jgi:hypothetical protein
MKITFLSPDRHKIFGVLQVGDKYRITEGEALMSKESLINCLRNAVNQLEEANARVQKSV